MSTILNALAKAKRESDQPAEAKSARLENELAYRQPVNDERAEEQAHHAGMNRGIVLGVSAAVLFLLGSVLVATIMMIRFADNAAYAGNQSVARTVSLPAAVVQSGLADGADNMDAVDRISGTNIEAGGTQNGAAELAVNPLASDAVESAVTPVAGEQLAAAGDGTGANAVPGESGMQVAPGETQPVAATTLVAMNFAPAPEPAADELSADPKTTTMTAATASSNAGKTAGAAGAAEQPHKKEVYLKGANRGVISSIDEVSLSGIIYSAENPRVMINDKVVRVGETIRGVKVKDIQPDSVVVVLDGEEYTLYY